MIGTFNGFTNPVTQSYDPVPSILIMNTSYYKIVSAYLYVLLYHALLYLENIVFLWYDK